MVRLRGGLFAGLVGSFTSMAIPCAAQNLPPHTIIVNQWPEDMPCSALKKYPDGTYETLVPFVLYYQVHLHAKYRNLNVTRHWDHKCAGLTK